MVLDFLSEYNLLKILGTVYLRYSSENRFKRIALKNKGREAEQKHRAGVKESDDNRSSGKLRSKRLRTTVIVASFLLILTIGLFVWNSSNRTPPDSGQQPGLEVPKAAILDGLYSESPNITFSQTLTNYLSAAGYTVDIFRGENVTIDLLRNIAGYKVVILRLHSTIDPDFRNLYVFSGEAGGGLRYLINSLYYSSLATLLSVGLGIPLAYAHGSRARFLPPLSSIMVLLPLGISSITVAYGLMTAIAVPTGLNMNPWPIIVLAQTIIGLPFTARSIEISRRNIDPLLIEQADALGASRLQRLFFVELPLLAPGILVGAVFAFAMAIGEMSATLFIALPQNLTLAVAIHNNLDVRNFVEAGASALILMFTCVLAFLTMEKVSGGSVGGALKW